MLMRVSAGVLCAVPVVSVQAQLVFTEVASEVGIESTYMLQTPPSPVPSYMAPGGAVGDFNNDGWDDIFVLGGDTVPDRLYLNDGDGTFTDHAQAWGVANTHVGVGAVAADYNADGFIDIYVTSHGPSNTDLRLAHQKLYHNNGNGTFTDVAEEAGVHDLGVLSPDGFGAGFGDYDLDGDLDLAVTLWRLDNHGLTLFRNEGDGTFVRMNEAMNLDTTVLRGFLPCFADMDRDGYPELLVTGDFGSTAYYQNERDGTFKRLTRERVGFNDTNAMGAVVADLTGDGMLDWYVSNIYYYNDEGGPQEGQNLFVNQGNHSYVDIAPTAGVENADWAWGADACDFDNDGDQDLVTVTGWYFDGAMPNHMYECTGPGQFNDVSVACGFEDRGLARGLSTGDFDHDGDLDVVVFNHGAPTRYYRNDCPVNNAWVSIALETARRPDLAPQGIGTTMVATVAGEQHTRYVDGAQTFLSNSSISEHFGLGEAVQIDDVEITWPDGRVSLMKDITAGQRLTVKAPPTAEYPDTTGDGAPDWIGFDPDGDGVQSVEDIYAITAQSDIDNDGTLDHRDGTAFARFHRGGELKEALTVR